MDFLLWDMGRTSIPAEASLFDLLSQCFDKFRGVFNLEDPHGILTRPSILEGMLNAVFDTGSRAFVTEKSPGFIAGLEEHDKLCLYVQAVAGMVLIFRRLSSLGRTLSAGLASREIQLFKESQQRTVVLSKIADTSLLSACYARSGIVDFVVEVVEGQELGQHANPSSGITGDDLLDNTAGWVTDRPCKNMGLPWGFTIMAIN
jgi:hypothetical protein